MRKFLDWLFNWKRDSTGMNWFDLTYEERRERIIDIFERRPTRETWERLWALADKPQYKDIGIIMMTEPIERPDA